MSFTPTHDKTPTLSKVKIGSNTYWLKDADLREEVGSLLSALQDAAYMGVTATITGLSTILPTDEAVKNYVDSQIETIPTFEVVVDSAGTAEGPSVEASEATYRKIYLVPDEDKLSGAYVEWLTIRSGSEGSYTYSWEKIGTTKIDLTDYYTKEEADEKFETIEHAENTYATTTTVKALTERVETVENNLSSLSTTVDNLSSTVTVLAATVTDIVDRVKTIEENIGEIDLLELEGRVGTLEGEVDDLQDNKVDKSQTIAGISLDHNITIAELEAETALDLKAFAHTDTASGEFTATTISGIKATGTLETEATVALSYETTTLESEGTYTPEGSVVATATGTIQALTSAVFGADENGVQITGSVSAPTINLTSSTV